jgi:hypothetical protein
MSDPAVDTTPTTGDMASALHAAASEAGLDRNGNPVAEATDDTTQDTTLPDASPASDPQTTDDPDAPTIPETVAAPPPDTKPKGPIPFQRHEAILKTTREKVATETREAVEKELGPWRQVMSSFRPDEFAPVVDKLASLSRDPVAFYRDLGQELQRNGLLPDQPPPHAPTRSAAPQGSEPEPDLVNPDTGELLYSAPQLQKALAWREQQIESRLRREMQPLMESHRTAQQERELSTLTTAATAKASEAIAEAQTWEGFDELKPKIAALMRNDRRYSLEGAYLKVYQTEYVPTRKQRERESVVAELKQKGRAGSSGISPNSRSNATPTNGTGGFREVLERELAAQGMTL